MKQFNYKCTVAKNGMRMYYKRVDNKWKRISNKLGISKERISNKLGISKERISNKLGISKERNSMKYYNLFIITAPHAKCLNDTETMCDQNTGDYARKIYEYLLKKNKNVRKPIIANIHRKRIVDLNRPAGRRFNFKQRLKKLIENNSRRNIILLDIHSFNRKKLLKNKKNKINPGELGYILTTPNTEKKINEKLKDDDNFTIQSGSKLNDIVEQSVKNENVTQAYLIEFDDSLTNFGDDEIIKLFKFLKINV